MFGLRPGHIQSLQAMISFLKPGHGDTVFASNRSICDRIGGIDERTLRRHINRFVELGFITRNDSSNRKRYRIHASGGESISFGLSLAPLRARADELVTLAQRVENDRRDRIFLRKQILARLAHIDAHDPHDGFVCATRKALRRKLSLTQYRTILADAEAECQHLSTVVDTAEPQHLSVNDGQTARHLSKSNKEEKDIETTATDGTPPPGVLASICTQAQSFTKAPLREWPAIIQHAQTLAPMMGIDLKSFEKATKMIGPRKASCAIFIILQLGNGIRHFGAYFHAITMGTRRDQFNPTALLDSLAKAREPKLA